MAREGNNEGCKLLAKQLVMLRKQKARFHAANSKVCLFVLFCFVYSLKHKDCYIFYFIR